MPRQISFLPDGADPSHPPPLPLASTPPSSDAVVITSEPPPVAASAPDNNNKHTKNPFFLTKTSNAIAIRIKELDQCCCANVPCISIVKEYCESRQAYLESERGAPGFK